MLRNSGQSLGSFFFSVFACSLLFGFGTARGEVPCSAAVEVRGGGWPSPQPLTVPKLHPVRGVSLSLIGAGGLGGGLVNASENPSVELAMSLLGGQRYTDLSSSLFRRRLRGSVRLLAAGRVGAKGLLFRSLIAVSGPLLLPPRPHAPSACSPLLCSRSAPSLA